MKKTRFSASRHELFGETNELLGQIEILFACKNEISANQNKRIKFIFEQCCALCSAVVVILCNFYSCRKTNVNKKCHFYSMLPHIQHHFIG